ncbi:hypothetical protein DW322_17705 [Rhodococcus rhodnii]|uniref:Uncharacterized protein n=1 Tax=Rhodococcus rhodnii TaxID=38312 RepID=A0A6P2CG19_9NOCA|nr:hypothetical protein DW322_17705 [Rhodococcus rhodnii]
MSHDLGDRRHRDLRGRRGGLGVVELQADAVECVVETADLGTEGGERRLCSGCRVAGPTAIAEDATEREDVPGDVEIGGELLVRVAECADDAGVDRLNVGDEVGMFHRAVVLDVPDVCGIVFEMRTFGEQRGIRAKPVVGACAGR